ncbi:ATP-dependent 6-phosphofructokinase 7 [Glycine max]|nr:ATP-dependent 6-phosphofructokinase 7 [Glycine max]
MERAAALAEGLPAPTLCSSGDVRDLNIEYFKYAHQHRITEGQNKVVITYRMWARLMSSTNQPSFTIAKTISEEKREEEANGHVPKAWSWSKAFIKEFDPSLYTLNKFSCIALAGVSTEYLIYGFSEGGLDDIRKLDLLLKGLGFTQKKADSHVRWPLLNTVLVLWRHEAARGKVAEALSMGKSIGSCIDIIENSINVSDLLLKL